MEMESSEAEARPEFSAMEELKASIQAQRAALGVVISVLEARISALETELKEHAGGENDDCLLKPEDSGSIKRPWDRSAITINLTAVGLDGSREVFRVKRRRMLKELMSACCVGWNEKLTNVVFLYKGRLLRGDQTPQQLKMEDGDEIVAENRWI